MMDIDHPIEPTEDNSKKLMMHSRIPIYEGSADMQTSDLSWIHNA